MSARDGDAAVDPRFRRTVPEPHVLAARDTVQLTLSDLTPLDTLAGPLDLAPDALDDLHLLEELGRGGMGVVYRALQRSLDREVAVKLMDPRHGWSDGQYERFRTEVLLAASLNHRNVAHIHWVRRKERFVYYVMELVPGEPLDRVLERRALDEDEVVAVFGALCDGLTHAHERGVVHRDLKPANILIECGAGAADLRTGRPVLVDFGLAARRGESAVNTDGMLMGTPAYMSPEQASGDPIDHLTDIYSLGITLFEALTGRVPFSAPTPLAMALKHLTDERPDPRTVLPTISDGLAELTLAMISRDPMERPQTCADVRERLASVPLRGAVAKRPPTSPRGVASRPATVLTVELTGFLANANEQPLARTSFLLDSWLSLIEDAVVEHGGAVVRQEAAQVSAVFARAEADDDHGPRALAALRRLYHALRAFNRTHGRRESFTAGLEAGLLFVGVLREGQRPVAFGPALDRSVRLAEVRHLGIGLVGAELSRTLAQDTPLEPLIGVSEELGAASLVAPSFLVGRA